MPVIQSHYCKVTGETYESDDLINLAVSTAVSMVTDNALLGFLVGGDVAGSILGDFLNDGDLF
jgi:hypothetical protein